METHYRFSISVNHAPVKGEMSVLFSGEGAPVAGHYIGPAVHDYYLIHLVLEGEGRFESAGGSYRLGAGDVFVIFPDALVKYEADHVRPWTYTWIGFAGEYADKALASIGLTNASPVVRGVELRRMTRRFRALRAALDREGSSELGSMEAAGMFRLILTGLGQARSRNGEEHEKAEEQQTSAAPDSPAAARAYGRIDRASRLMTLQYSLPLSIEDIARSLGYHRAHLTRLFKEATGLPPMQYLLKIRMKKAETLLESDLTIAQVAASVGYGDPLFFSKQFRKWSGVTPSEFRAGKRMRGH